MFGRDLWNIHFTVNNDWKSWGEIEIEFGTVRLSGTGDVMVDSLVWNKMAAAFNTLNELTGWLHSPQYIIVEPPCVTSSGKEPSLIIYIQSS